MITLYGDVSRTRANRCSWMLAELGLAHQRQPFAFRPGQPKPAEFLALNPNGKCPTLTDSGFTLFESLAINLYLAKKHGGPLAPRSLEEDALMTQWSFWVVTEIEKPQLLAAALCVLFDPHEPDGEELELALAKLARPWTALDGYLQDREFLVGERFTAADLNVAAVMHMVPVAGIDISRWPSMARWLEACLARPAAADCLSVNFKVPRPASQRDILAMFL
ncbi:MAG: glutathione S-transferase family protein [Pannonibacter indicus]